MNKLYNTQEEIASGFSKFLLKTNPNMRLTQLKIIPYILLGMISNESVSAHDIAKSLKGPFCNVQLDSTKKRIRRFYNNSLFDPYFFYRNVIHYILQTYKKKHADKRIHICFDHVFYHENYTVIMFSMRVGKQGIPLYFQTFKGISNNDAFKIDTIKNGINEVHKLFENLDFELIFLADRWFHSVDILKHINDLGHSYSVRLPKSLIVYDYNKNEKHYIRKEIQELRHLKYHSVIYNNIPLTDKKYITNIIYGNSVDTKDPWIIATNKDPKRAIKDYSYRFGAIECLFKNQKTNGFNIEKISNASLKAFTTMYSLMCTCILYLTILGADYSKNTKCYKNEKIETHKNYYINGKKIKKRIMSLFNTGLTLFKRAFNSTKYIRLPFTFILVDI